MVAPLRVPRWWRAAPPPSAWHCLGLVAVGYVAFALTYLPINALTEGRAARTLLLPGEAAIPLVPAFEFAYALAYVLPLVIVWRRPDGARVVRLVRAFALTLVCAAAIFLLFPVTIERPALTGHSLAIRLIALEYRDKPYNLFPSLHVALATLVALACGDARHFRWWLPAIVGLIAVSTVLVKQHYIVDALAGLALATWAWRVAAPASR
jgi:membrane-associated phospholipid phosphatase